MASPLVLQNGEAGFSDAYYKFEAALRSCVSQAELSTVGGEIKKARKGMPMYEVDTLRALFMQLKAQASADPAPEPPANSPDGRMSRQTSSGFVVVNESASNPATPVKVRQPSPVLPPPTIDAEWEQAFGSPDYFEAMRAQALAGKQCAFRGVAWRLFLGCLPPERVHWLEALKASRQIYADLRQELIIDPRQAEAAADLAKNNPLSQDEDSPWQQFFRDKELKADIKQDVTRTFPEVDFFQEDDIQELLLDILFCYARRNEDLSYRQGMHEILAPIVYVLKTELYEPAAENAALYTDEMKTVLDAEHLAHDAYTLFCQVMQIAKAWFMQSSGPARPRRQGSQTVGTPFQEPDGPISEPSSAILIKLHRIQNRVLKEYDELLHGRLVELDIAPQIYGLRWIRLLFGREFQLEDMFVIWDAIFADGPALDLTDYLCVAMLLYLRNYLLMHDFSSCLNALMRFPPVENVHTLVQQALHVRQPHLFPPAQWMVEQLSHPVEVQPVQESTRSRPSSRGSSRQGSRKSIVAAAASSSSRMVLGVAAALGMSSRTSSPPKPAPGLHPNSTYTSPPKARTSSRVERRAPKLSANATTASAMAAAETVKRLLARVEELETESKSLLSLNQQYGEKLSRHIGLLQRELFTADHLPNEDHLYLALAGMREVKDVLLGHIKPDNLGFRPASPDEPFEEPSVIDLSYQDLGKLEVVRDSEPSTAAASPEPAARPSDADGDGPPTAAATDGAQGSAASAAAEPPTASGAEKQPTADAIASKQPRRRKGKKGAPVEEEMTSISFVETPLAPAEDGQPEAAAPPVVEPQDTAPSPAGEAPATTKPAQEGDGANDSAAPAAAEPDGVEQALDTEAS